VIPPPRASPVAAAARWWWQFHQAATCVVYAVMLVPLWMVRGAMTTPAGRAGTYVFLMAFVAATVSITLRLHLWFTLRSYPGEWHAQTRRVRRWVAAADAALVLALVVAGALLSMAARDALATAFVALAVAIFISFAVIEPTTTRAAFERSPR
jgi:hypothetical protein